MRKYLKYIKIADFILIFILSIFAVVVLVFQTNRQQSEFVQIYVQGKLQGEYSLAKNKNITIKDGIVAQIEDNKIFMLQSTCKNKTCIKQSSFLPIICLPNKILIKKKQIGNRELLIAY